MEFYEVIKKRKSIKKFEQTAIDRDKLLKIIDMAMRAPSWKNKTPYKFIVVESDKLKLDIANAIENKTSAEDRKSTRLNSSHANISYAVFCLKKKKKKYI